MSFLKKLSLKKKLLLLAVVIICFVLVFRLDNTQQKSYAVMKDAYEQMNQGNYEKAAEEFQQYLDSHSSKIYWKFQAIVNTNDESSYENVQKALEECTKYLSEE